MTEASGPRCRHFGACGGCRTQDRSYAEQLRAKQIRLQELLGMESIPLHPSPEIWFYRNKMEYSFQDVYPRPEGRDDLFLGLKQRGRWSKVLDLQECFLLSPETPALLESVRRWARREGLPPYNLHRHVGFLRHLILREGKNTGERMVILNTADGEFEEERFVACVRDAYPATTVLHGRHRGRADAAILEEVRTLSGPGVIEEEVLGRRFRISPSSFFQTNTRGAEVLYGLIRRWVAELRPRILLDLYCGGGGISLCVADLVETVVGIEAVPDAVADARQNASRNGVTNATFEIARVEEAGVRPADLIVVDPPRAGLHPRAAAALAASGVPAILYVSCNPRALSDDVVRWRGRYRLDRVEGVDLFPHTDHVEALALLREE